jgi:retinol dehydrogenase-12
MAYTYPQLTFVSVHPGVVQTNLTNGASGSPMAVRILLKVGKGLTTGIEKGVKNQLWASVSKEVENGEYYEPVGLKEGLSAQAKDDRLGQQVMEWTERELRAYVA